MELYGEVEGGILAHMAEQIAQYDYYIPAAQHQRLNAPLQACPLRERLRRRPPAEAGGGPGPSDRRRRGRRPAGRRAGGQKPHENMLAGRYA